MTKNVGKYTIDLYETYNNCKEMIDILVYEFNGEDPINDGKPVGDFYIHGKISECNFSENEIEHFISFPWHTQFKREYVAI